MARKDVDNEVKILSPCIMDPPFLCCVPPDVYYSHTMLSASPPHWWQRNKSNDVCLHPLRIIHLCSDMAVSVSQAALSLVQIGPNMPHGLFSIFDAISYICFWVKSIRVLNFVVLRSCDQANRLIVGSRLKLGHKVRLLPGRTGHHAVKTYGWRYNSMYS